MSENQHTTNYSCGKILVRLRGLEHELGRPPTTRDADEDETLPSLDTIYRIAGKKWNEILQDAGIRSTQVERYSEDERDAMIADIQRVFSAQNAAYLTSRAYGNGGRYATSTIKEHFGSWSAACAEAGVPSGSKHGDRCVGPQGAELESHNEQRVAFLLHRLGIEYEVHKPVPETDRISDFYLPDFDLWVEIDGYETGQRPNAESFEAKCSHYESSGFDYVVVSNPTDLKNRCLT